MYPVAPSSATNPVRIGLIITALATGLNPRLRVTNLRRPQGDQVLPKVMKPNAESAVQASAGARMRALWELGAFFASIPALRMMPRATVIRAGAPGLMADDVSTRLLREFLQDRGYSPNGWELGRNYGPRAGVEDGMTAKLSQIAERSGRKVSVIGWSLGGLYARALAVRSPEIVRQVITLGPVHRDPRASNAWRLYEMTSGLSVDDLHWREVLKAPLAVRRPRSTAAATGSSPGNAAWSTIARGPKISRSKEPLRPRTQPAVLYAIAHSWRSPRANGSLSGASRCIGCSSRSEPRQAGDFQRRLIDRTPPNEEPRRSGALFLLTAFVYCLCARYAALRVFATKPLTDSLAAATFASAISVACLVALLRFS